MIAFDKIKLRYNLSQKTLTKHLHNIETTILNTINLEKPNYNYYILNDYIDRFSGDDFLKIIEQYFNFLNQKNIGRLANNYYDFCGIYILHFWDKFSTNIDKFYYNTINNNFFDFYKFNKLFYNNIFFHELDYNKNFKIFINDITSHPYYLNNNPKYIQKIIHEKNFHSTILIICKILYEKLNLYNRTIYKKAEDIQLHLNILNKGFRYISNIENLTRNTKFMLFNFIFKVSCKIFKSENLYNYLNSYEALKNAITDSIIKQNIYKSELNALNYVINEDIEKEHINTYLSGINYANEDGIIRKNIIFNYGENNRVYLFREQNNKYDKNAIAVYSLNSNDSDKLGYIPRYIAQSLSKLLDNKHNYTAYLSVLVYDLNKQSYVHDLSDYRNIEINDFIEIKTKLYITVDKYPPFLINFNYI